VKTRPTQHALRCWKGRVERGPTFLRRIYPPQHGRNELNHGHPQVFDERARKSGDTISMLVDLLQLYRIRVNMAAIRTALRFIPFVSCAGLSFNPFYNKFLATPYPDRSRSYFVDPQVSLK
jgi:hypothetical protein